MSQTRTSRNAIEIFFTYIFLLLIVVKEAKAMVLAFGTYLILLWSCSCSIGFYNREITIYNK